KPVEEKAEDNSEESADDAKPEETKKDASEEKDPAKKEKAKSKSPEINLVLVADVDMISPGFFDLRAEGTAPEAGINFEFDNVTFVLNVLDALADDDRFIEIRKRRRYHPILTKINEDTEAARRETAKTQEKLQKQYDKEIAKLNRDLQKKLSELQRKSQSGGTDIQAFATQLAIKQQEYQKHRKAVEESLQRKLEQQIDKINRQLEDKVQAGQDWYKRCAVLLPPILPLTLAFIVFCIRRVQERQGAVRGRMKK
ncbi:MAG: OmpH family outer membrane protein, partial [Planctomycetia bacterium]